MTHIGYDAAYAATRYAALDAQIKGHRAQIKDLTAQRDKYKAAEEPAVESD
jgi:hypothetical protein